MSTASGRLSPFNRALSLIPRRAERQQTEHLRATFVESGVAAALESIDHQILYGRRGTGKTHALRYVESSVRGEGDLGVYVDLRQIGSPEGLFFGNELPATERAARLLVDLLRAVHDELLAAAIEDDKLVSDVGFVRGLDQLDDATSTVVLIGGEVEVTTETEASAAKKAEASGKAALAARGAELGVSGSRSSEANERELERRTAAGHQRTHINFGDVFAALKTVSNTLTSQRVWLLLDEWGSIPRDVQPVLAEFLVRCVLPLDRFTVKIGAIEQESMFRAEVDGRVIGIELGADVAADVNLDEFMVYEENEAQSCDFFRGLLFKHLAVTEVFSPE